MKDTLIITDPGHGGINPATGKYVTPGKRAHHAGMELHDGPWFYEGVFNRQVETRLQEKLALLGLMSVSTIPEVPNWQDVPLNIRCRRANFLAKGKSALFVSIHANAFDSSVSGYEVFSAVGSEKGARLGWHVLDQFADCLSPEITTARLDWTDGTPTKNKNYYVLHHTHMPAILIELGFMDNKRDLSALMSPAWQDKAAQAIADGIMCYLSRSPIIHLPHPDSRRA